MSNSASQLPMSDHRKLLSTTAARSVRSPESSMPELQWGAGLWFTEGETTGCQAGGRRTFTRLKVAFPIRFAALAFEGARRREVRLRNAPHEQWPTNVG